MSCNTPTDQYELRNIAPTQSTFELWNATAENDLINNYVNESIGMGGTPVKFYKLLGIYEQDKLLDLTGNGTVLSSGDYPEFVSDNIVANNCKEWRSTQKGKCVLSHSYIGYDFGDIKLDNGRKRYGINTEVKYHITCVMIQQHKKKNRITKARIERSNDGIKWYGVTIIDVPDDDKEHWLDIKQSAPSRFWKVKPLAFNGGDNDFWAIRKFALSEYTKTAIRNVQDDLGFIENRDRNYSLEPIIIKGVYDLADVQTDLTRFGIEMKSTYTFKFGFNETISKIGRPIIIGDIVDVLCEVQYDTNMTPIHKYLEVTDTTWSASGFTPGWQPTLYAVTLQPMVASQETIDIIGEINAPSSDNAFFNLNNDKFNQIGMVSDSMVRAIAYTDVPEAGTDTTNIQQIPQDIIDLGALHNIDIAKLNINQTALYVEDGLPPNGLPYTEGDKFIDSPKDGDYHRLTYTYLKEPTAPRLHQYSTKKKRWIYKETDRRWVTNQKKPQTQSFIENGVDVAKLK
jgi:hypothetical protein